MESQYSFSQTDIPPCPQLSLSDFLGVVCSFQQLVEHYDLQAGPFDFVLSLGEKITQTFFTSTSTNFDGSCLTLTYNKAMFYLNPENVWMVCPQNGDITNTYNPRVKAASKLSMYYFLWLYFQSIPETKYFVSENYVDKKTAEELCKDSFDPSHFVIDLIPDVAEMAKRIVDHHKDQFQLKPITPQIGNKTAVSSSSILSNTVRSNEWSTDLAIAKDAMAKLGVISKQTYTTSDVYKLPLHPDVYPWMTRSGELACHVKQITSILAYVLFVIYRKSQNQLESAPAMLDQFADQFSTICNVYFKIKHSFNLMCRTLCWNQQLDLCNTLKINCSSQTVSLPSIPTTWSCDQFRYGLTRFPAETSQTISKFFQHRIEPNITNEEIMKCKTMDDISAFLYLRNIYNKRRKVSLADYDKGSYRVEELDDNNFFTKLTESVNPKSYLDFGGSTGEIAGMIGQRLGLGKQNTHCFDIELWYDTVRAQSNDFVTPYYTKLNTLPYDDETFDFVSSFVTLHHLPHLDLSLSELVRVMKDGAILLVREHDCVPSDLSVVIDLEHSLYEMVEKPTIQYNYLGDYFATYWSKASLSSILEPYGFVQKQGWDIIPKRSKGFAKGPTRYYYNVFQLKKDSILPPPPPEIEEVIVEKSMSPDKSKMLKSFESLEVAQELERLRGIDMCTKEMTKLFTKNEQNSRHILLNYIMCKAYDCLSDPEPVYKTKESPMANAQLEYDWRRYRCNMKQLNSAKTYLLTAFSKIQTNVANISKPVTIECYETQFGMDLDTDFYLFGDDLNRINSATSDKLRIKVAVQIIRVHYLQLSTIFSSMPQNLAENTYVWFGGFYIHQGPNWARCWNDEVDLGGKPNLLCSDKTEIVNVPHFVMPPNIYEIVIKTLQQCQTLRYDLYNKIELFVPQFVSDGVIHQHCPGVSIKSVRKNWKNPFKTESDHVVQLKQIVF